ncbi:MAG: tRNA lysidine(34) synthetase TilS [Acholeplasmataceae bacterium]|nr:tRNA lysidine(34) synthetase TilS [Acholeplasmataceae bacterium]
MLFKVKNVITLHLEKKIVLSVSGGVDSTVLLYLLKELNADLVVVHFNHQQRQESILEAEYVKMLADKFGYPFEYFKLDIKEDFHNEAHNQRRFHLINVAKKYETDVIITAHHLNDLLETILMRISRGSNLLGYSGFVDSYYKDGIYFLKPLIFVSKEEILTYAKEHNIRYFIDSSNQSDIYTRNRYRQEIIPLLLKENEGLLKKIIQYNKTLSEAFFYIRKTSTSFLKNSDSFLISDFLKLDDAIRKDVIAYLLEKKDISFTYKKIEEIISFLETGGPNSYYDLGKDYIFKKVYKKVLLEKKRKTIEINQKLNLSAFNVLNDNTIISFSNDLEDLDNYKVVLCYNKLALPLFIRNRRPKDMLYFHYGHKKVKDFYIDKKIPKDIRDNDLLIVDSNNQVLAILGKYYNENPKNKDKILLKFVRG